MVIFHSSIKSSECTSTNYMAMFSSKLLQMNRGYMFKISGQLGESTTTPQGYYRYPKNRFPNHHVFPVIKIEHTMVFWKEFPAFLAMSFILVLRYFPVKAAPRPALFELKLLLDPARRPFFFVETRQPTGLRGCNPTNNLSDPWSQILNSSTSGNSTYSYRKSPS